MMGEVTMFRVNGKNCLIKIDVLTVKMEKLRYFRQRALSGLDGTANNDSLDGIWYRYLQRKSRSRSEL